MSDSTAIGEDSPDEELLDYRAATRTWLAENLHIGKRSTFVHGVDRFTPRVMAENRALQRRLWDGGYAGISWQRDYGGQGLTGRHEEVFTEEAAAYVLPDFGILSSTTFQVCAPVMLAHAQPAFLRSLLPQVLAGDGLICQFFSEPSSGSDLAGVRTRAVRDGDEWVLNGQKVWSSFAQLADWGLCLARTNWDVPKHRGLTWFAIPCDAPGLTIRGIRQIDGREEFCEDFFDDVRIPDAYRIGEVDDGWTVTQLMLVLERGAWRATGKAATLPAGELAPHLVDLARASDRLDDPVVRQKIARGHTIDFVGRALAARIAEQARLGNFTPATAAYGKLFRGIHDPILAELALEIGGASALSWSSADDPGHDAIDAFLNARTASIAGGTNEMQRNAISERVLGMPREPRYDTNVPFKDVPNSATAWLEQHR